MVFCYVWIRVLHSLREMFHCTFLYSFSPQCKFLHSQLESYNVDVVIINIQDPTLSAIQQIPFLSKMLLLGKFIKLVENSYLYSVIVPLCKQQFLILTIHLFQEHSEVSFAVDLSISNHNIYYNFHAYFICIIWSQQVSYTKKVDWLWPQFLNFKLSYTKKVDW